MEVHEENIQGLSVTDINTKGGESSPSDSDIVNVFINGVGGIMYNAVEGLASQIATCHGGFLEVVDNRLVSTEACHLALQQALQWLFK